MKDEMYRRGLELFNRREFYECHEVLEELWFAEAGPAKRFYQGIIQLAVAFYHHENGNPRGALKLLERGLGHLTPYAPVYDGLNLQALLPELGAWRPYLQGQIAGQHASPDRPPPILRWEDDFLSE